MVNAPGFFFPSEQMHLYGEAILKNWGTGLLYSLVCGRTNHNKRGRVGRGLAGAPVW